MRLKTSLYKERLKCLKELFKAGTLLIEHPTHLFYLTGLPLSKGRLFVSSERVLLLVDDRYLEMARHAAPCEVLKWGTFCAEGPLACEQEFTSYAGYLELKKEYPHLKPVASPTLEVRAIKDRTELSLIKESATLLNQAYTHIKRKLKVGVTEEAIAKAFYVYTHQIADGPSFEPIVAFGKNGSMPHYRSGKTTLKKNMAVLLDLGVKYQGYCSDMTRMVTFGKVPKKIEEALILVEAAKKAAEKMARPGKTMADLQEVARKTLGTQEKYFVHSVGHGIGLDVHELPKKGELQENMVFTIEPGLYYPDIGGVRLEDMYVVTKQGCKKIT